MRFLDWGSLLANMERVTGPRNEVLKRSRIELQAHFMWSFMFVGKFYRGVGMDPDASADLRILAHASDSQLDALNKLLAFWWFWAGHHLADRPGFAVEQDVIREGLRTIWGLNDAKQMEYKSLLDNPSPLPPMDKSVQEAIASMNNGVVPIAHMPVEVLRALMKNALESQELSLLFVAPHLRNSQVELLQEIDRVIQR